jgi:hypothetical protein
MTDSPKKKVPEQPKESTDTKTSPEPFTSMTRLTPEQVARTRAAWKKAGNEARSESEGQTLH